MDSELRDLYQELILDHGRHPRNFRLPESYDREAEGLNPLCGDQVRLFVSLDEDERIKEASFNGHGCAISIASASLMTQAIAGMTTKEAGALFEDFHRLCTQGAETDEEKDSLFALKALSGVRAFPTRVKCATLAWHTLKAALEGNCQATTEKQ